MTDLFTSVNMLIEKAPRRIELLGDKTLRPEPAQHIIEFPGGAVYVETFNRAAAGDVPDLPSLPLPLRLPA